MAPQNLLKCAGGMQLVVVILGCNDPIHLGPCLQLKTSEWVKGQNVAHLLPRGLQSMQLLCASCNVNKFAKYEPNV